MIWIGHEDLSSNPIAFPIELIPLGKVCMQLFFKLRLVTSQGEGKLCIQTC